MQRSRRDAQKTEKEGCREEQSDNSHQHYWETMHDICGPYPGHIQMPNRIHYDTVIVVRQRICSHTHFLTVVYCALQQVGLDTTLEESMDCPTELSHPEVILFHTLRRNAVMSPCRYFRQGGASTPWFAWGSDKGFSVQDDALGFYGWGICR